MADRGRREREKSNKNDPVQIAKQEITQLIARLGDKSATPLEENIIRCSDSLVKDMPDFRDHITDILFQAVLALPTKTPIYGTLVGLISLEVDGFASDILKRVRTELHIALRRREFYSIKFLVRFVAELYNARLIAQECVLSLLVTISKYIAPKAEKSDDLPQHIRDFYVYILITTLPLVGPPIAVDTDVLSAIHGYMQQRTSLSFPIFEDDFEKGQKLHWKTDWLNQLYQAFTEHEAADWPLLHTVHTVWHDATIQESLMKHDGTLSIDWFEGWEDDFIKQLIVGDTSTIPEFGDESKSAVVVVASQTEKTENQLAEESLYEGDVHVCHFTSPRSIFRIFPADITLGIERVNAKDTESNTNTPKITKLERFYLDEYVQDILHFFHASRKDCVVQLLNLPFAHPNYDHFLVESILGELLRIPSSAYPFLYYGVVLIDLVKAVKETLPPVLADAVQKLFAKTPEMDVKCFMTFVDWFAYHLSNFDFKWNWAAWQPHIQDHEQELTRKTQFIKEVLHKCVRLSYWERIEKTVPPSYVTNGLLPPKPTIKNPFANEPAGPNDQPVDTSDLPPIFAHPIVKEIFARLRGRQGVADILSKALANTQSETEDSITRTELIQVLTRGILTIGSKSFTHMQAALDRYKATLHNLAYSPAGINLNTPSGEPSAEQEEAKVLPDPDESPLKENGFVILQATWDQFINSSQHWLIACLKMLHARLITPSQLVRFMFQPDMLKQNAHKLFYWELLDQSIRLTLETAKYKIIELRRVEDALMRKEEHQAAIARAKEEAENAKRDFKALLFHTMQSFALSLNDHISKKGSDQAYWYLMTLGFFKAVGRKYYKFMRSSISTLMEETFKSLDPALQDVLDELQFLTRHF